MNMISVMSSNVSAVGYDELSYIMRVRFHNGATYDYFAVSKGLYESMLLPNCWGRLGNIIKQHSYRRVF